LSINGADVCILSLSMAYRQKLKPSLRIWGNDQGPFEGNDVRVCGGLRKRCILCGVRAHLRLSHAIPKWAFQWHKQARGGVIQTTLWSRGVALTKQDGNKHYLLCDACENLASIVEDYALAIVLRRREKVRMHGTRYLLLERYWKLRIDLITRFVAITALRVHYAPSVPLAKTQMPVNIRRILRRAVFGKLEIDKIVVAAWRFVPPKKNPDHDPREGISTMYEDGQLGPAYLMLAGGIEWAIFFDARRLREGVGDFGFKGRLIERIASLPYTEYRLFKYPEKWAPAICEKMTEASEGAIRR
jgi:hypothetical protein